MLSHETGMEDSRKQYQALRCSNQQHDHCHRQRGQREAELLWLSAKPCWWVKQGTALTLVGLQAGVRCSFTHHSHNKHAEKCKCDPAKVCCRSLPLSVLLCALEPPLVTNLNLEDVQGAVADCCCDQLVPAALITISCSPDKAQSVREEPTSQQGGACHLLQKKRLSMQSAPGRLPNRAQHTAGWLA